LKLLKYIYKCTVNYGRIISIFKVTQIIILLRVSILPYMPNKIISLLINKW